MESAIIDSTDLQSIHEQMLEREDATEGWAMLRETVLHEGGIKPTGEDYREIPVCLRRRAGLPIDTMADLFGYDYIEEFANHVGGVYRRYQKARQVHIPHLKRHAEYPDIQRILDEYYECWRMCCEGRRLFGSRKHDAVAPIYEAQRQIRHQYQAACLAAGIAFATV